MATSHSMVWRASLVPALLLCATSTPPLAADDPPIPVIQKGDTAGALRDCPGGKVKIKAEGGGVVLLDAATGKALRGALPHDAPRINLSKPITVACWAFSPDGKLLATGAGYKSRFGDNEGQVCVWEIATGKRLAELSNRLGSVRGVAFSKDGKTVYFDAEKWAIDGP